MKIEQPIQYVFSTLISLCKLIIQKRWELFACLLIYVTVIIALLQIPSFQYYIGKARLNSSSYTSMFMGSDNYGYTNYYIEMAAKNGHLKAQEDTAYTNLRPQSYSDMPSRLTAAEYWYTKTVNNAAQHDYGKYTTEQYIKESANTELQRIKIYRKVFREALKGDVNAQFRIAAFVDQKRLPHVSEKSNVFLKNAGSKSFVYLPLMLIAAEKNHLPAIEEIILKAQRKDDPDIEMIWLRKGAKLNSPLAQYRLGKLNLEAKKRDEAIKWLSLVVKAETNEYTQQALEELITLYEEDIKNPLYLKYVREGSKNGSELAREKLFHIYLAGEIVPRNTVIAQAVANTVNPEFSSRVFFTQIDENLYRIYNNISDEDKQIARILSDRMMESDNDYLKTIDAITNKGNSNGIN